MMRTDEFLGHYELLPHDVQQVLIGSLMGDGSLSNRGKNARFEESHCVKQAEYLKWKAEVIVTYFGGRFKVEKYKSREIAKLRTRVHPLLMGFRQLWYPNGKKAVPTEELQKLNELGLAVWYQDDGSYLYQGNNCTISIAGFKEQANNLQKWFKERWGLSPSIYDGNGEPVLHFSVGESGKFLALIGKHVHPSMIYKLGSFFNANLWRVGRAKRVQKYYRQIHLDKAHQYCRKYRLAHPERVHASGRKYRLSHLEKVREKNRKHRLSNLDKYRQYQRKYMEKKRRGE